MVELPRGTVTLLFTDIEGSTQLLQQLGRDHYVRALERIGISGEPVAREGLMPRGRWLEVSGRA